jgi:hypothetical protein
MNKSSSIALVLLPIAAGIAVWAVTNGTIKGDSRHRSHSSSPELEYLKAINKPGPPQDPQLLFLLMGAFANANQQAEGVYGEFIRSRSDRSFVQSSTMGPPTVRVEA